MISAYTAQQIRDAERPYLEAGVPLMDRAANALADVVAERLHHDVDGKRVLALVGAGNNGGDAFYVLARLAEQGAEASALPVADRHHEPGAETLEAAGGTVLEPWQAGGTFPEADVVLDAILGTGARGALSERIATALAAARKSGADLVAVDAPTGYDTSTGAVVEGAVGADATATFGADKAGLLLPPAAYGIGELSTAHIGLDPALPEPALHQVTPADLTQLWPVPGPFDSKYTRGVVGILAGSATFPGAGLLSVLGAQAAGAGMIRYLGPRPVLDLILHRAPEVVGADGRVQAHVLGSGFDDAEMERARTILGEHLPCVVDAGALDLVDPSALAPDANRVLTPHAGEAARLLDRLEGEDAADETAALTQGPPVELARRLAHLTGSTVLLKGSTTIVVDHEDPDHVLVSACRTSSLATAGAGDVLGGIIGALLGSGLPGPIAAVLGAQAHGLAATRAAGGPGVPITASQVATSLPGVLRELLA